jgi:tRNA (guanosine-2'-O-)-methyltransferase
VAPSRVADAIAKMIERYGAARVCEVLLPFMTHERMARIEAVLDARLSSVAVVVEDTYDPHNAVAAVRTSEAFGLHEFHAIEGADHFRLAPGITRGCHRWLDMHRWKTPAMCAESLRARGFVVYATAPAATVDLETIDVSRPVAVMFGNEHAGLTKQAQSACDGAVRIPMFGFSESFNLSVSVALVVHRLAGRRRELLGRKGDLDDATKLATRARWMALKVRSSVEVVDRLCAG